ncbi:uncharacterized protein LOC111248483 isoform X1 [Varroa destructor]|uniref:Uncharacterized protein n=3 Tax=Varroa TaxID=62624 RepID=A0A7M7JSV4_VARDE|nr:uncharacterized protein LOC111248483 isoform X1 [Varroa destructor]
MLKFAIMQFTVYLALLALAHRSWAQPAYGYSEYPEHSDLDTAAQDHHEEQHREDNETPMPYSFQYSANDPEGSHSHSATSDGNTVTGEYSIQLADGRMRTVKYTADENGYRAEIVTNELGTESKNPADVIIKSSAPTGPDAALEGSPAAVAAPAPAPAPAEVEATETPAAKTDPDDASASQLDHVFVQSPTAYNSERQQRQKYRYYGSRYAQ